MGGHNLKYPKRLSTIPARRRSLNPRSAIWQASQPMIVGALIPPRPTWPAPATEAFLVPAPSLRNLSTARIAGASTGRANAFYHVLAAYGQRPAHCRPVYRGEH